MTRMVHERHESRHICVVIPGKHCQSRCGLGGLGCSGPGNNCDPGAASSPCGSHSALLHMINNRLNSYVLVKEPFKLATANAIQMIGPLAEQL